MGLLDGHRAVVTGGGSGIGAQTCRRMAAEGAQVAILDLNGDSLIGPKLTTIANNGTTMLVQAANE